MDLGRHMRHLGYKLNCRLKNSHLTCTQKHIQLRWGELSTINKGDSGDSSVCKARNNYKNSYKTHKKKNIFLNEKDSVCSDNDRIGYHLKKDKPKIAIGDDGSKLPINHGTDAPGTHVGGQKPPLCFVNLINALRTLKETTEISKHAVSVYYELLQYNDWKTGLTLYTLLKKFFKPQITPELSSKISYLLLQTYARCGKSAADCFFFIEHMKSIDIKVDERTYILACRISVMESFDSTLKSSALSMVQLFSHLPEARSVMMIYYSKTSDLAKVIEFYNESLKSLNIKNIKQQKDTISNATNTFEHLLTKGRGEIYVHPWFVEHTLIMATAFVFGTRDKLYDLNIRPPHELGVSEYEYQNAKKLIYLCVKLLKCPSNIRIVDQNTKYSDEDYVSKNGSSFIPNLYNSIPSISTLEIFKNSLISLFRATVLTDGIQALSSLANDIKTISTEHSPSDPNDLNADIHKCVDISMALCLLDFLRDVKTPQEKDADVILSIFGGNKNKSWIEVVRKYIHAVYNLNTDPPILKNMLGDFKKTIVPGTINNGIFVKRKTYEGSKLFINVLHKRSSSPTDVLSVNRINFPSMIISLASYIIGSNPHSYAFFEYFVYASFSTRHKIPLNYYKCLLKYYADLSESNREALTYFAIVHEASNMLYRIRMNNHPVDSEIMTDIMKIITSDKLPTFVLNQSTVASKLKHPIIRITSYLHLHIESIRMTPSEEFVAAVIKGLLSNELYLDFVYAYAKFKYNHGFVFTNEMLVEIIKQFRKSRNGCLFVTNEFRFELARELVETKIKWSSELVDAILDCCLGSGSISSALSFASSYLELISVDALRRLLYDMDSYGSLCNDERHLVFSWIEKKSIEDSCKFNNASDGAPSEDNQNNKNTYISDLN